MNAFRPVDPSIRVAKTLTRFAFHAYYTLFGDGVVERDYGIGLATDQAFPASHAIWPTDTLAPDASWITQVGLAADARHQISADIVRTVGDFEMFSARILRDIRQRVEEERPRPLRTLLTLGVDLSVPDVPQTNIAFVQLTDHGELAQMRGWKCEAGKSASVEPSVALASRSKPWGPAISQIGFDYDADLLAFVSESVADRSERRRSGRSIRPLLLAHARMRPAR